MKSRLHGGDGTSFWSTITRGTRAALIRVVSMWIIAGFVLAAGFGGSAVAGESVTPAEWSEAVTLACAPHPVGPAYNDWLRSAIKYNEGMESLKQKDLDSAVDKIDAAIKLYPNNALAHVARGALYERERKYDRTLDEDSQAIRLAPGCFVAFNGRCWARAIMNDLQAALTDCNEALRLYQKSAASFDSRGFVYLKMGDLDKAIADYDAALQIDPFHVSSLFGRGKARLMKGDEARGSVDILVAQHYRPDIAEQMARYGVKLGGSAVADESVTPPEPLESVKQTTWSACAPHPSGQSHDDFVKGELMYNQGLESLKQKDKDRATGEFDNAIKLYPNNALARIARGKLYQDEGKYDRAVDEYSQAIKLAPNCFEAFNNRCATRAIIDDLQAALADCNEALRLYQGSAKPFGNRGFVYLKMGDLDKAIADYDAALRIDPFHVYSLFGRGKARLMKGDDTHGSVDIITAQHYKPDIAEEMARYGVK